VPAVPNVEAVPTVPAVPTLPAHNVERINCFYLINTNFCRPITRSYDVIPSSSSSSSSSSSPFLGSTVRGGLWPVEKFSSIFSYLSPTLTYFSLLALEDLFLLLLSSLSWVCLLTPSYNVQYNDRIDTRNKDLTKKLVLHIHSLSGRL